MVVTGETVGCQKCVRNRVFILSRIWSGFESRQNHAVARNPGVSMSGQVLFHPSHICQIGAADQGRFVKFGFISRGETTAGARTYM